MSSPSSVPSHVVAGINQYHSHLLYCKGCFLSMPNPTSSFFCLPPSTVAMLSLSPFSIIQVHCKCKGDQQPYYLCVPCMVASPQSKFKTMKAERWLHKHVKTNNHRSNMAGSSASSSAQHRHDETHDSVGDDDVAFFPDSPSTVGISSPTALVQPTTVVAHPFHSQPVTDLSLCILMNEPQRAFFQYEREHKGLGFAHIVKKAFGVAANAEMLHRDEIEFHLDLCSLCVDLTRSQLRSVGTVIDNVIQYYTASALRRTPNFDTLLSETQSKLRSLNITELSSEQSSVLQQCYQSLVLQPSQQDIRRGIFKETKPPTNYADMERCYLTGPSAVYRSLPTPTVHLTESASHAYIRLPEVVASFLASGICDLEVPSASEFANCGVVKSYYTSKIAREVYEQSNAVAFMELGHDKKGQCFSLHFKDWADDAQKNNVRSNSTSYNIRTITFMQHGKNGDVRYYSYVISLSLKGSDHEEVERIFNEDLMTLSKPNLFYSGYHKQTFWAIVSLVAGIRDRPARGETFHVGNHGHMFGKRFRYAAFHDKKQPFMPCPICHASRLSRLKKANYVPKPSSHSCNVCADLDYDSPLLTVTADYISESSTRPGEQSSTVKYPRVLVPGSPVPPASRPVSDGTALIAPVRVTFELLLNVCEVAFFNYHNLVYMRDCRKRARTTRERNDVGRAVGWTQREFKTYCKSVGANEFICSKMIAFSSLNVNTHPTALLVELRTKILPSSWQRLGCSLSHQLDAVFHLVFHGISMDVWDIFLSTISSLKISGNLSLKSTYKTVLKPLLSGLHDLQLLDLPVLPFAKSSTGTDFSHAGWVGSNKLAFCMIMPYIVSHVRYYHRAETGREMTAQEESKIQHIQLALFSFYCSNVILLQRSTTKEQVLLVGEYLKVFLREITEAQKTYISKPENLSYLTTGNFLSLLNLEENVGMYGPLRYFWDGLDEKNVQKVKRAWPHVNMSTNRWLASLLENVTREQHLHLLWQSSPTSSSTDDPSTKRLLDNLRIINSDSVESCMASNGPFSALYDPATNTFYLVVRKGGKRAGNLFTRQVALKRLPTATLGSCQYYRYTVSGQEHLITDPTFSHFLDHKPVVFLPFQYLDIDTQSSKKAIATIIALEDHKVYQHGGFVMPSILDGQVEGNVDVANAAAADAPTDDNGFISV